MVVNFGGFKNAASVYYHDGKKFFARQLSVQVTDNDKLFFKPLLNLENQDFVKIVVSGKEVPLEDSFLIINDRVQKINAFDLPPLKALEKIGVFENFDDELLRDKPIIDAYNGNAVLQASKEMKTNLEEKLAKFLSSS